MSGRARAGGFTLLEIAVAMAIVGDALATQGETSNEAIASAVQVLVSNFEKSGSYDGKRHKR